MNAWGIIEENVPSYTQIGPEKIARNTSNALFDNVWEEFVWANCFNYCKHSCKLALGIFNSLTFHKLISCQCRFFFINGVVTSKKDSVLQQ